MDQLHLLTFAPPERVVEIGTLAPGTPFMFVRASDGRLGVNIDYVDDEQEIYGMTDTHTWYRAPRGLGGGALKTDRVVAVRSDEIAALEMEYETRRGEWENAVPTLVQLPDGRSVITLGI